MDRGHSSPRGDFVFAEMKMKATNIYKNTVPMHPVFNRFVWLIIEVYVRLFVTQLDKKVAVYTRALTNGNKRIGKIAVPSEFYKIIILPPEKENNKYDVLTFLLPHEVSFEFY